MPSPARILLPLVAFCCGAVPAISEEPPTATSAPIEFSVLTPGLEGGFYVHRGFDWTFTGIGGLVDRSSTAALRDLVSSRGYDPSGPIADAIPAALDKAGRNAIYESIKRRPAGRIQSLAAEDLPQDSKAAILLDITINWIGLYSDAMGDKLHPGFSLTWRLISPDGILIAPGREFRYAHAPSRKKPAPADPAQHSRAAPAAAEREPDRDKQVFCSISSINAARTDPTALWECFDEAYKAAAEKFVTQLPGHR